MEQDAAGRLLRRHRGFNRLCTILGGRSWGGETSILTRPNGLAEFWVFCCSLAGQGISDPSSNRTVAWTPPLNLARKQHARLHQPAWCLDLVLPQEPRNWKSKHQELKATVKGFKNQIAAVTKSREQSRLNAEASR